MVTSRWKRQTDHKNLGTHRSETATDRSRPQTSRRNPETSRMHLAMRRRNHGMSGSSGVMEHRNLGTDHGNRETVQSVRGFSGSFRHRCDP
jgi:hypothetical protein